MYRNILVPVDGSPLSNKAVREAAMIAKEGNGKLLLFHVVAPYQMPVYSEGMTIPSLPRAAAMKASARRAGRILAAAERKARTAKVPLSRAWAISGAPRPARGGAERRGRPGPLTWVKLRGAARVMLASG